MLRSIEPSSHVERAPSYVLAVDEALRGMVWRELVVPPREVVYVKSIVEASEGICSIFGERGGRLLLASPPSRERELEALVDDLRADLLEHAERTRTDGGAGV
jgi:hypothetical protein